jgi:hypothetical protein
MTFFNTKLIQGEEPMNTFHARNPLIAACLAIAGLVLATPALASNPLLFEWSGTDSNNDPFSVAFTVTDVESTATNYDFIDFGDPSQVEVITEELGQDPVVSDVTSTTLGGSFTYPSASATDPYNYLFAFESSGNTFLSLVAAADDSNIGLTYDGNTLEYMEISGTLPFAWVDPTTASSLADLFPVGTYNVTGPFGNFDWNGGSESPTPTSLTISVVPEPTSLALLGLGGLAMLRRTRRDV